MARKPFVLVLSRPITGNNLTSLFSKFGMRLIEEHTKPEHHYLIIMEEANLPATKDDRSIKHLILASEKDTLWTANAGVVKVRISNKIILWVNSAAAKLDKDNNPMARQAFDKAEEIVAKLYVTTDKAAYSALIGEYLKLQSEFDKLLP